MRKTKLSLAVLAVLVSSSALASPSSYSPVGSNLSYGDASNPNTIYSTLANPASNALTSADTDDYRVGAGFSLGGAIQTQGMENSADNFDANIQPLLDIATPTVGDALALESAANAYLKGYDGAKLGVMGTLTIPILTKNKGLDGGVTLDYTRQHAMSSEFIYKSDMSIAQVAGQYAMTTGGAGLSLNYKILDEFALGYGTKVYSDDKGFVSLGATARFLSMKSSSQVVDFGQVLTDNINGTSDAVDYVDNMDNGKTSDGLAADIGVAWNAENYTVGLVAMNVGSPKFKVADVSVGTASVDFAGDIATSYVLEPQLRLSGQWHSADHHWTLGGSYDLVDSNDLNDADTKWATASASYATNSAWYIPDVRIGVRDNLLDNLNMYKSVGLTLGMLNIDVTATDLGALGTDKDTGVMFSTGIEMDF